MTEFLGRLVMTLLMVGGSIVAPQQADAGSPTMKRNDPNDTAGVLDIESIAQWRSDGKLRHSVRTFAAWRNDDLSPRKDWIVLRISTASEEIQCCSYVVWVRHSSRRGLYATIHRIVGDRITKLGRAPVRRPSGQGVVVTLTPGDIELAEGDSYKWEGESSLETRSGRCSPSFEVEDAFPEPGTCWDWTRSLRQTV